MAQAGLPDSDLERVQLNLVCSVHTPLAVSARLSELSTSYKRYRDFTLECPDPMFDEVIRRCVGTLPHDAVHNVPSDDDIEGRILDACVTISILQAYVGFILTQSHALVEVSDFSLTGID